MSFKKTDLAKQMAVKLHTQMKGAPSPQRFGKQSTTLAKPEKSIAPAAPKLVAVTCRLPADIALRLRERALSHEGGIHGLMSDAAAQWLEASATPAKKTTKAAATKAPDAKAPAAKKSTKKAPTP